MNLIERAKLYAEISGGPGTPVSVEHLAQAMQELLERQEMPRLQHHEVDWSEFDKKKHSKDLCVCRCTRPPTEYRSHVRHAHPTQPGGPLVSREPCPNCGQHDQLLRAHSDERGYLHVQHKLRHGG